MLLWCPNVPAICLKPLCHTQAGTGITTKLQTSPKTQECLYNSHSHIKGTKLAPKGPYENEKHAPEKPYMRGNAPICTHCTGYMLGTNADTHGISGSSTRPGKTKMLYFCVFVFFFQSQKVEISIIDIFRRSFRVPRGPERSTNRLMVGLYSQY